MRALAAWIVLGCLTPAMPCTIFKVTGGNRTLVGNNEDWENPRTRVWFRVAEPHKHGRVFFGFDDGWAQGGMNDQGLFFDWVAGYKADWSASPARQNYAGNLCVKMLEESATVEDALALFRRYNERAFGYARIMVVDRTGASAIVGWRDGDLLVLRPAGAWQAMGFGGAKAEPVLREMGAPSVDGFRDVLKAALQSGRYPTQYSNVYDLAAREVYVYDFNHGRGPFRFKLAEELKKGDHRYEIPALK
jgi:hypothetical protein